MKIKNHQIKKKLYMPLLFLILIHTGTIAQTDSLAIENSIVQDTIIENSAEIKSGSVAQTDSLAIENSIVRDTIIEKSTEKKSVKRVSDFKIYGGISASKILLPNSAYESSYSAGYILGASYKRGKFGYWEIGLNYNSSLAALEDVMVSNQTMKIGQIEMPFSVGLNLLAETRRILGLRIFGGLAPGYINNVGDNQFDLSLGDFNQFQLGGRVGVGVDVLFLFVEGGYQYGIIDLLKEQDSNLSQLYVLLGFRF